MPATQERPPRPLAGSDDPGSHILDGIRYLAWAHGHVTQDGRPGTREDIREVSSCADSRATLEKIMAVHESNRLGTCVSFPLANRDNPYATWLAQE